MTVFQKLFADVLPVLQERYLNEGDREQLSRFAKVVDQEVDEQIAEFGKRINTAIDTLEAHDFNQEFDKEIKAERDALAQTFTEIDNQLNAIKDLQDNLLPSVAGDNTAAALAAVSGKVTEAQTALQAAREKVNKFGNAAGRAAGLGLKAAVKTVLPTPF